MFKKIFLVALISITNATLVSAQDIFWSFDSDELVTRFDVGQVIEPAGSAYIFSDALFNFDALDLDFSSSNSVIQFTGGEAFNPQSLIGSAFDFTEITIATDGSGGQLFSVAIIGTGIPSIFDPIDPTLFKPEIGPNGAFLLARVDFEIFEAGKAELDFTLGSLGALQLPDVVLDPSFGSALFSVLPITPSIGDINLDGSVNFMDIQPFIMALASSEYEYRADINCDGMVSFADIASFILLLTSPNEY